MTALVLHMAPYDGGEGVLRHVEPHVARCAAGVFDSVVVARSGREVRSAFQAIQGGPIALLVGAPTRVIGDDFQVAGGSPWSIPSAVDACPDEERVQLVLDTWSSAAGAQARWDERDALRRLHECAPGGVLASHSPTRVARCYPMLGVLAEAWRPVPGEGRVLWSLEGAAAEACRKAHPWSSVELLA